MSRPQFVLVAGPNGANKSTLSQSILGRFPQVQVIDPDAIAKGITGSFATVDQEQLSAGKKTLQLVQEKIDRKQSFLVESTISGQTYLRYVDRAREAGFRTVFIYVGLSSMDLSAERVAKRVALGGHRISGADIKRRYPRSLKNLKSFIKLFESSHIYDNSDNYKWMANFRDGTLRNISPSVPSWLKSAML